MWSVYKGLEATIGLTGSAITNFFYNGAAQIKDDPGDMWNWWEDYSQYLVMSQGGDGSWPGYYYWPNTLATAWNINILNATAIPDGNGNDVPEPGTLALFGGRRGQTPGSDPRLAALKPDARGVRLLPSSWGFRGGSA